MSEFASSGMTRQPGKPGKPAPEGPGHGKPLVAAGCRGLALAWIALMAACAPIEGIRDLFDGGARMARTVTITRDSWGVPHIEATTDAGVVFGMGYAQAEDNFWQLEEDYISALGRAASIYGDAALGNDLVRAAFEVERYAREEYQREPAERRALWDAYAAGINHYLSVHREVRPRVIRRFEPWFPFALSRNVWASSVVNGVPVRDVVATPVDVRTREAPAGASAESRALWRPPASPFLGDSLPAASNAWVVAPSRTRDGTALLFLNPHVDFFGNGQRWEMHIRSATGWHFAGFAVLGMPVAHSGHNEVLGWTHTSTAADVADAWIEAFDHPTDPLAYRHGDDWPRAIEFEKTIDVRTDAGIERRRYRFLRTHRGPVVALSDGSRASIRIARHDDGGAIQQWLAMSRALSFDEFRSALAMTALPGSNTMYADTAGNIHYLHGSAVPRRHRAVDWNAPLDGADPELEWAGYHSPDELPHVTNPRSGWIQNTNSSPFSATGGDDNPDPAGYREYMAPEPDNARSRASRRLLGKEAPWTFGEWRAAAFDAYVHEAEIAVPRIADEWERLGAQDPERAHRLDDAIDELRNWNFTSSIGSHAMTLFSAWAERFDDTAPQPGEWPYVRALEQALDDIEAAWGTWRVAWGQVNRLQRVHTSGTQPFDTASPSLPVPGGPGALGIVFNFDTRPGPDGRIGYGIRGHSWVGAIEFGARVRAHTIVNFGQSADSVSPHWFDQAPHYARGEMKALWFTREEVEAAVALRYRPGEEPRAGR
jgi:penicillin amidase